MRASKPSRKGAPEATYLRHVAARIREQRQQKGMSRRELSEAAGVSDRYVTQLESGRGNVSILLLRKLARALNVPIERLLPDDAPPRS
jgi:XRE family transcriptional regulator, aerobic/anaerobic benzoate catabolism transcriptional regulator